MLPAYHLHSSLTFTFHLSPREFYCVTVKVPALVAVPPGVVIPIGPVIAPVGTVAVSCVSELTVNCVAATPPKVTCVVCNKMGRQWHGHIRSNEIEIVYSVRNDQGREWQRTWTVGEPCYRAET